MNKLSQSGVEVIDPIGLPRIHRTKQIQWFSSPPNNLIAAASTWWGQERETSSKMHKDLLNAYNSVEWLACLFCLVLFCWRIHVSWTSLGEVGRDGLGYKKRWFGASLENSTFLPHPFLCNLLPPFSVWTVHTCIYTSLKVRLLLLTRTLQPKPAIYEGLW